MTMQDRVDWVVIMVVSFVGGCVANIIEPPRRGAMAFAGAVLIGIFCGGVAGLSAHEFGLKLGWTIIISAACAVLGERILSAILVGKKPNSYTIHGGQNVFGENEGGVNRCDHKRDDDE